MGDGADDLREREEEDRLQKALHMDGRCDPYACPICIAQEIADREEWEEKIKLKKQNAKLKRACKRFLKWDNITMDWANERQWESDIKYAEKVLKEKE